MKIAYQYEIRIQKAREKASELNFFPIDYTKITLDKSLIRGVSYATAKVIISEYEWLKTLPVNYRHFVGIYFGGVLGGVVCYCDVKFGGKLTLFNYPAICLGRGACTFWTPKNTASYLISKSIKLLFSKQEPIYIIGYTDWNAGEIGTIYQSLNWFYLGHRKTKEWIDSMGKRYDINTPAVRACPGFLRKKLGKMKATKETVERETNKMISQGYKLVDGSIRGRYATIAGIKNKKYREMYSLLLKNKKDYPKRIAVEGSRENCVSSINEGLGQFQDTAPLLEIRE